MVFGFKNLTIFDFSRMHRKDIKAHVARSAAKEDFVNMVLLIEN